MSAAFPRASGANSRTATSLVRSIDGPAEIRVGESENEELVVVGEIVSAGIGNGLEEIIVVGDPESVNLRLADRHVRTEGDSFNFCGDVVCRKSVGYQCLGDVEEERFADGVR